MKNWVHRHKSSLATALLLATSSPFICNSLSTTVKKPALTHSHLESSPSPVTSNENSPPAIPISTPIKSTAAILNINARAVTPPLITLAREVLGSDNVHVTATAEEAMAAARSVIRENYSLVLPMGGDGTLSCWIDTLVHEIMRAEDGEIGVEEAVERLPLIGYVPRGTGNGLGHVVGCWQVHENDKSSSSNLDDNTPKKSLLSRINFLSRRKQKRQERTKRLLTKLKDIGDSIQQQRLGTNTDNHSVQTLSQQFSIVEMPMMQVIHKEDNTTASSSSSTTTTTNTKGDLCFFAGSGFDSLMLHDFQRIKAWSSQSKSLPTFLKDALSSVAGYCVALVTLTLPQTLKHGTHKIHVKVTTEDEEALWVDHRRGDFSELAVIGTQTQLLGSQPDTNEETIINNGTATKKQHLIYSGTTGILAASTTPYYGGGLRLFPYARLIPNKLQLRLGRISPLVGFFNIPKIFEGSYREKTDQFGCLDFIGDEFDVEVSSPVYEEYLKRKRRRGKGDGWWRRIRGKARVHDDDEGDTNDENGESNDTPSGFPFQHSGESMGIKERFRLRVVKKPVKFVSFLRPRVIVDK